MDSMRGFTHKNRIQQPQGEDESPRENLASRPGKPDGMELSREATTPELVSKHQPWTGQALQDPALPDACDRSEKTPGVTWSWRFFVRFRHVLRRLSKWYPKELSTLVLLL